MPWASHKLRNGTTDSKMAARRWRAMLVVVGPQQVEMTRSSADFGHAGPSCQRPRTCGGSEYKHWFGTLNSER